MKSKLLVFAFLCSLMAAAQTELKPEPLYNVTLFKWIKDADGTDQEVILDIFEGDTVRVIRRIDDQEEDSHVDKLKIADFEKGLFRFINGEKIVYKPAYDNEEMIAAQTPEEGQQVLHITVVTAKSHSEQGTKEYPGEYFKIIVSDYSDEALQAFFKYFDKKEAEALQKLLHI